MHMKDSQILRSTLRKYSRIGSTVYSTTAHSDLDKIDIEQKTELEADTAIKCRS